MRAIKVALAAVLGGFAGLWLLADTLLPEPLTYFSFRSGFVQLTGVLAFGAMSTAMVLAVRPKWLERPLNGLDKMYRLHKWLGISALVLGILHWWWAQGTKWMVGWGWLTRPVRSGSAATLLGAEAWLRSQRGLAETLGEWAFYAAVVLIVLALWKRFPYHLFAKTHRWISVAYLVLVLHAVVLVKFDYWAQPVGWAVALLMVAGTAAALIALSRRIGASRRVRGVIESIIYYPELRVLETAIRMDAGWPGHRAGQFAFATSREEEGAHPYTIASAWSPRESRIVFITKALGDHTKRLRDSLRVGMPVTVEGPYGCFDFEDSRPRQIWIGPGIGITPFIARMKQLAAMPGTQEIDLFHPTADISEEALRKLAADAKAANVRLHVLVSPRDGLLSGERIRVEVPDWESASVWFCGPPRFGEALRADFVAHGLPPARFHQELFEMR